MALPPSRRLVTLANRLEELNGNVSEKLHQIRYEPYERKIAIRKSIRDLETERDIIRDEISVLLDQLHTLPNDKFILVKLKRFSELLEKAVPKASTEQVKTYLLNAYLDFKLLMKRKDAYDILRSVLANDTLPVIDERDFEEFLRDPRTPDDIKQLFGQDRLVEQRLIDVYNNFTLRPPQFKINIRFFFKPTSEESYDITNDDLDFFMEQLDENGVPRYLEYLDYIFTEGKISDVSYSHGKVTFTYKPPRYLTKEKLIKSLLDTPLEDTMFEGQPGNVGIYPFPEEPSKEMGLIDFRDRHTISVQEI